MPADFAVDLCGYRPNNFNPNTSDNGDSQSIALGRALFEEMGVPSDRIISKEPGTVFEEAVVQDLKRLRPDLDIGRSGTINEFDQYAHLAVLRDSLKAHTGSAASMLALHNVIDDIPEGEERQRLLAAFNRTEIDINKQERMVENLRTHMPQESLLKIDVFVAEAQQPRPPMLHVALSFKWSLRTDRAQDCVSQGAKLVAQRRGRMPHFAVVTMEPRPAMLKILGDGSGAVDCIYHPNLPALQAAIDRLASRQRGRTWPPKRTFERLLAQGRIRDYGDLVREIRRLPGPLPGTPRPVPQGAPSDGAEL